MPHYQAQKISMLTLLLTVISIHPMERPPTNVLFDALLKNPNEAKKLITAGVNVNTPREFDGICYYPLHIATDFPPCSNLISLLLDHGALINQPSEIPSGRQDRASEAGKTALHMASCSTDAQNKIKLLLERGAAINACDASQRTPLHDAVLQAHGRYAYENVAQELYAQQVGLQIVKELLSAGADPELRDDKLLRPIDYAYRADQISLVRELLLHGSLLCNENAVSSICSMQTHIDKFSPLEQALIAGRLVEIRISISSQPPAKVNEILLFAAAQKHVHIVEFLMKNGADPTDALERLKLIMKRPLSEQLREDYELIKALLERGTPAQVALGQLPKANLPHLYSDLQRQSERAGIVLSP